MNRELEELILAREAMLESRSGDSAKRLAGIYREKLDAALANHPGLERETLRQLVEHAHLRWLAAQRKPPTLPPMA